MSVQTLDSVDGDIAAGRPLDAWPDDPETALPADPAAEDDFARSWAECNSDLARHLASIPEPPDSPAPPASTAFDFAEGALADGPEAAATILATVDPGPGSAVLVGMLDPARLTPASMVGVIAATEKLASWVQALQHRWLAAFTAPGVAASREGLLAYASAPGQPLHRSPEPKAGSAMHDGSGVGGLGSGGLGGGRGDDTDLTSSGSTVHGDANLDRVIDEVAFKVAAAEVSAALHFSPVTAQRRVRQALDFTMDLPGTLQALSRGRIDRGRALTILDRTENLPADLRRKVETAVLPKATSRTPGQLRGIVDRAVISVDPAAAKKRQIKAREERHVTVRPERDGMSTFIAEIAAEHAAIAFSVLDRVATTLHRRSDETRRIGALRADVFSDIFDQLATQGAVDLRATIGGRAVITHDPLRYSWISDTDTIACRFDADTSLIDPHEGNRNAPDAHSGPTDAGRAESADRAETETEGDATADTESLTDGNAAPEANGPDQSDSPADTDHSDLADESGSADSEPVADGDMCCSTNTLDQTKSSNESDPADFAFAKTGFVHRDTAPPSPDAARDADPLHLPLASADNLQSGAVAPAPIAHQPQGANRPIGQPFVFPTQQGRLTHVNVTIAATTLAGLDDLPGELDGYGPLPADLCRALAISAASITAVGVDPACGRAVDVGRTTYRPRLSHRDHVTQRDRTCRFPGCRQPARRCQIDHSEEFCDGGPTCPCNLACLCKFHHDLKTTGLWDALQHPDASITWTSPTGRTYRTHTPEWPLATVRDQASKDLSAAAHTDGCQAPDVRHDAEPAQTLSPHRISAQEVSEQETTHAAPGHAATDEPPF